MIESNLLSKSSMHDVCWCQDPSDFLESAGGDWCVAKGHDSYYVRGQGGRQKDGLGVQNDEYVLFHPYQMLPLYKVDYVFGGRSAPPPPTPTVPRPLATKPNPSCP